MVKAGVFGTLNAVAVFAFTDVTRVFLLHEAEIGGN